MAEEAYYRKDIQLCSEQELKQREVRALEKISRSLEGIQIWLEDLNAEDWSQRIQWYLSLFKEAYLDPKPEN